MSSLRSALDELRSEDLGFSSDEELVEGLMELERASRVLDAERSRRLVEIERRGAWAVDGHLSMVSWLTATLRVGFSRASQQVKLARALRSMTVTSRALGEAALSSEAVGLLVSAKEAAPEAFSEAEGMLVDAAGVLPARGFRAAVAYWRQATDAAGAEERARRMYEGRHLHVSPTIVGMVRIDGDLDPESGQTLIGALRAVQDAWTRDGVEDPKTAPQRRAGAALRAGRRRSDHPETARRLACDAGVSRVLTRGDSEPMDVGRKTPVVPAGMRRALVLRDGGCSFPGCGRPQAWCDAHHIEHRADGGVTALENLVLLCRPHHRAVHEDFRVEMTDGKPAFSRSDGSRLAEDRAPP
jgi:hypothetical protein